EQFDSEIQISHYVRHPGRPRMGRLQVFLDGGGSQLITFVVVAVLVWGFGTCIFLYFWPPITYSAYKRAVVQHGLGGGPIPINTLYAVPTLSSPAASNSSLLATGTNDVLYVGGRSEER